MKKLFPLMILAAIFTGFLSCKSPNAHYKKRGDTVMIVCAYSNPYMRSPYQDTCFRVIFDSLHIGDEKNYHQDDTVYYLKTITALADPRDPTKHTILKKTNGADSTGVSYQPVTPYFIYYEIPKTMVPYHSYYVHPQPINKQTVIPVDTIKKKDTVSHTPTATKHS